MSVLRFLAGLAVILAAPASPARDANDSGIESGRLGLAASEPRAAPLMRAVLRARMADIQRRVGVLERKSGVTVEASDRNEIAARIRELRREYVRLKRAERRLRHRVTGANPPSAGARAP
jgi:hypothetical protein